MRSEAAAEKIGESAAYQRAEQHRGPARAERSNALAPISDPAKSSITSNGAGMPQVFGADPCRDGGIDNEDGHRVDAQNELIEKLRLNVPAPSTCVVGICRAIQSPAAMSAQRTEPRTPRRGLMDEDGACGGLEMRISQRKSAYWR